MLSEPDSIVQTLWRGSSSRKVNIVVLNVWTDGICENRGTLLMP